MYALALFVLLLQTTPQLQSADAAFRAGYAAMERGDLAAAHTAFAKVVHLTPKVAAGHSAYGAVLLAEGNLPASVVELELTHHLDPKDAIAASNLGIVYSGLRRYAEAVALFQTLPAETLPPEAILAEATALDAAGDIAGATAVLQRAAVSTPSSATIQDALGTVLAQQQIYDAAKRHFEQALALDNHLASAHLHLGSLYLAEQNLPAATDELGLAARLTPDDPQTLLQLGRAQTAARQDDAAIATLTHAHAVAPASVDATYALALALQNAGRSKEALPLFAAVAKARPQDSAVLTNDALALVQTGDARQAETLYQRALTIDPGSPVLREDLGVAYLQQSDLDRAIVQFQAGLRLPQEGAPLTAQLHYDLGLAWKLKDKLPEAIAEFESAERADATLPDPPYTLGVLYMQTGRFQEAASQLETATAMTPANGEAWSVLGNVYKQMDQPEKAAAALRRAIDLLPEQPSPHIALAAILAQQGDRDAAAAERRKGAELSRIAVSRQRADFARNTGTALLKQGKIAEAIDQLQAAVTADPTYAAAHRSLAEALARQGNAAQAALERQTAEALDAGRATSLAAPVK